MLGPSRLRRSASPRLDRIERAPRARRRSAGATCPTPGAGVIASLSRRRMSSIASRGSGCRWRGRARGGSRCRGACTRARSSPRPCRGSPPHRVEVRPRRVTAATRATAGSISAAVDRGRLRAPCAGASRATIRLVHRASESWSGSETNVPPRTAAAGLDQPVGLEQAQRVLDRRPADAEHRGELPLRRAALRRA